MSTDEKPSRNEDEYFAKQEAELLKARRAQAEADANKSARSVHFMKCPKCGADLKERDFEKIKVDVCTECKGMWLDAGEIDLIRPESRNAVSDVFGSFLKGLRSE
jgi:uncharacterized protein